MKVGLRVTVGLALALASGGCYRDVVDAVGRPPSCVASASAGGCGAGGAELGGRGGTGAAGRSGAGGAAAGPVIWPNELSQRNSDEWLRQNHDRITAMQPRVLLLDFYNPATVATVQQKAERLIEALAESSRYHAYSDAAAPAFLNYQLYKVIDLTDHPAPAGTVGSSLVPRNDQREFDPALLFNDTFTARYAIPDPQQPTRNLSLCEMFERGVVNEVWLAVGEDSPWGPLTLERKQKYDASGAPIPGAFEACAASGGGSGADIGVCLVGVSCNVTVRLAHLAPARGIDCDVEIRSFPFESQGTLQAVPYLGINAISFVNADLRARWNVPFDSWYDICGNSSASNHCITYPTPTSARNVPNTPTWRIDPFVQGCGSARFPPNARYRNDFSNTAPVQSRCEHFGMRDGTAGDGQDLPDTYTNAKGANYTARYGSDCGGGWQFYLRQSIPGLGNRARDSENRPMKNWWPFLFY